MPSYLTKQENKISKEFQTKGFIVRNVASNIYIKKIQNFFFDFCIKELKLSKKLKPTQLLNNFHKVKLRKDLNLFRLKLINRMINSKQLKQFYYLAAKEYLDILVGNELVMQNRINLSIQLPNDESSLLAVHSDVWSGDSPFEVVVWIPLVNCYKTKSMYILPPKKQNY